jgi:hypothetical protein
MVEGISASARELRESAKVGGSLAYNRPFQLRLTIWPAVEEGVEHEVEREFWSCP